MEPCFGSLNFFCLRMPYFPLFKHTLSSFLGKVCDYCIYHCLHRNQSGTKNKKHKPPKDPLNNTTLQITHAQAVSLIFVHTFQSHRPLADSQYSLFPFSAVKHCDRSPCGHGATCEEAPGGYRCLCPPGWTGRTCQLGQWVINMHTYVLVKELVTFYLCSFVSYCNAPNLCLWNLLLHNQKLSNQTWHICTS